MSVKQTLGERLREYRERVGLSIQDASEALGIRYGRLVSWENDNHKPNADYIVSMSALYDVSADELLQTEREYTLGLDEGRLIKIYRSLSRPLKDLTLSIARLIQEYSEAVEQEHLIPRPIYDTPASAGYGTFLDSSEYEMVDFPEDAVPPDATFGVRVSGDSMEPDYPNGSIVFAKQIKNLRPGDVGIFVFNNDGYIKKLGSESNLISINEEYDDIQVHEYDDLRVVGKVVGEPYIEETTK